eukprot:10030159-Lingulodinium_polyedra.AAC.1
MRLGQCQCYARYAHAEPNRRLFVCSARLVLAAQDGKCFAADVGRVGVVVPEVLLDPSVARWYLPKAILGRFAPWYREQCPLGSRI